MLFIIRNWNNNKKLNNKIIYVIKSCHEANLDENCLAQVEHFSHVNTGWKVSHAGEISHLIQTAPKSSFLVSGVSRTSSAIPEDFSTILIISLKIGADSLSCEKIVLLSYMKIFLFFIVC